MNSAIGPYKGGLRFHCSVSLWYPDGYVNYVNGANISGFLKVASAMREQGLV
jgi:glutamate dehydrogenase/leucine dehydrogenase